MSGYAMDILVDEIERRLLADEAIADAFKRAFEVLRPRGRGMISSRGPKARLLLLGDQ